jgi:hypothetical protein
MAEGEGRTLHEALEAYAARKATGIIEEEGINEMSYRDAIERFEAYHPIDIEVKLHPHNQWVKGFKVKDRPGG